MAICLKRLGAVFASSRYNINQGLLVNRLVCAMSQLLDKVPEVDIDPSGRFKYVLIDVQDPATKMNKVVVRGYARNWHADIFDETNDQLKESAPGLKTKCLGGGRIEHDPEAKTLKVYGYSQGFGKADHQVSVDLLKKKYADYSITWSDEGY